MNEVNHLPRVRPYYKSSNKLVLPSMHKQAQFESEVIAFLDEFNRSYAAKGEREIEDCKKTQSLAKSWLANGYPKLDESIPIEDPRNAAYWRFEGIRKICDVEKQRSNG